MGAALQAGALLGGYRLLERVGEGGFGVVWRAQAPSGRPVALKRLAAPGAQAEELAEEFRLLARLRHPHIVPVLDFGFDAEGAPYLVTAWIEGSGLGSWARGRSLAELAPALAGVLRALEYLHARGVLHRDLKPDNVLVDAAGHALLIDFGLAGLAGAQARRAGTPAYVPPERLLGQPEDARSDLYSFGVLLHELLHGALPGEPPPAPLSPQARAARPLLERLLAANPAGRPATANEVIRMLGELSGLELAEERGAAPGEPLAGAPGLVGREEILARCRRLLASPRHRVLLIEGEPGAGRTHLLRALGREGSAAGARVCEGRTLAALAEGLREPSPEPLAGTAQAAERLLAAAGRGRVLALLDDAHRLLPAELEELLGLAIRLEAAPRPRPGTGLVLVLAYRSGELGARGLEQGFARLGALRCARRLHLGPLSPQALPQLLSEVLGRHALPARLLQALHARAGGLPAVALELLGALRAQGAIGWRGGAWRRTRVPIRWPRSAAQALQAQLQALSPRQRDWLLWLRAAGAATRAALERWSGAELPEAALRELVHRRGLLATFVRPGEGQLYALASDRVAAALGADPEEPRRHDLLARERCAEPERWLWHAVRGRELPAAAAALARLEPMAERAPAAARPLLEQLLAAPALAGPLSPELAALRARAAIALAHCELELERPARARELLDALPETGPELEPALLLVRARALDRGDAGRQQLLQRIERALAGPEGVRYAAAALAAAAALEPLGRAARARAAALAERVLALAERNAQPALRGQALLRLALLDGVLGASERTRQQLETARRLLREAGDGRGELQAVMQLANLHQQPAELERGRALAEQATALAERLGDPLQLARALRTRARLLVRAGELRAARRALLQARRAVAGRGPLADYLGVLAASAYVALKLGRAREAEAHARRALRLAVGEPHALARLHAMANLAFALVRQGRPADALAAEVLAQAHARGLEEVVLVARYLLALDRLERGLPGLAAEPLADPVPAGGFHLWCARVDRALLLLDPEQAAAALAALPPLQELGRFERAKALVRRALVALARGPAGAEAALQALAEARAGGGLEEDHFLGLEAGLAEAEALWLGGRRAEAEARLTACWRGIVFGCMPSWEARAAVMRERLGGLGLALPGRLDALRSLLDRLERQQLFRDAHEVAVVLGARLPAAAQAERERTLARAERARQAMLAGLEPEQAAAFRERLLARAQELVAALPPEAPPRLPVAAAARLLDVYQALARERDPEALLPRVLDAAAGLIGAARAFLLLEQGGRLRVVLGRGAGIELDARRGGPSHAIAAEALAAGRPVRLECARSEARFATRHSVAEVGIGGVLAVPFAAPAEPGSPARPERTGGGPARGVIYLDDGGTGRVFGPEDEAVLVAFADQAALALAVATALRAERRRRAEAERQLGELRRQLVRTSADLATVRSALELERGRLQARFEGLLGASPPMRRVFELVERVAPLEVPVLITGETGTGKELTARAIHARSARRSGPFVAINCGALSPSLLEAELFGHQPGAFTGAVAERAGLFEQAHGGTLLLDEVGEMPPAMQAALLRVLESGEVRRLGSTAAVRVDVRVLAATHRDLQALVREGRFRQDLLFRLRVVEIALPPLRERLEDLPLLAEAVLRELAEAAGAREPLGLERAALRKLLAYPWPGNVRELRNVLARAAVLAEGARIRAEDIAFDAPQRPAASLAAPGGEQGAAEPEIIEYQAAKQRWIREYLAAALRRTGGNVSRAARLTGMKRQAFGRLLARHQLDAAAFRRGGAGSRRA
ncbi:MAG: hypothetical protein KatS3mg102_1033 [Planctomycetota bacterium]|nr:MAG: hypothetical protein KatS3mg102_1033 [Planctomycetota bacterium]